MIKVGDIKLQAIINSLVSQRDNALEAILLLQGELAGKDAEIAKLKEVPEKKPKKT